MTPRIISNTKLLTVQNARGWGPSTQAVSPDSLYSAPLVQSHVVLEQVCMSSWVQVQVGNIGNLIRKLHLTTLISFGHSTGLEWGITMAVPEVDNKHQAGGKITNLLCQCPLWHHKGLSSRAQFAHLWECGPTKNKPKRTFLSFFNLLSSLTG